MVVPHVLDAKHPFSASSLIPPVSYPTDDTMLTRFVRPETLHHLQWHTVQTLFEETCLSDWGVWQWKSMPFFETVTTQQLLTQSLPQALGTSEDTQDTPLSAETLVLQHWLPLLLPAMVHQPDLFMSQAEPLTSALHAWHTRAVVIVQALYRAEGTPPPIDTLRDRLHHASQKHPSYSTPSQAPPAQWRELWQRFIKQASLTKHEWASLFVIFQAVVHWVGWLKNQWFPIAREVKKKYPWLFQSPHTEGLYASLEEEGFHWLHTLPNIHTLLGIMNQYLDPDTLTFRADASPTYATLTEGYRTLQQESMKLLEDIARQWGLGASGMSRGVTEREGRWVLPVPSEQYHYDMGVIVARSDGGRLVYVEPRKFAKMQQQLASYQTALLQEEQRLLDAIDTHWREGMPKLSHWWQALGLLERLHAGAMVANRWQGEPTETQYLPSSETSQPPLPFYLPEAKHPLLLLHPPAHVAQVHGNTLAFGTTESQCLLISGPNAGGKTMSLKTLGLAVCLHRAGITLPIAGETSPSVQTSSTDTTAPYTLPDHGHLPWLEHMVTYLGDGQTIEEGLSSFSAYLTWLKSLQLDHSKAGWLVLMDEIAAATDPTEGGALAQAILDTLLAQEAWVCVTTHLETLKRHAMQHPCMQNASMAFDPIRMTPTYQLLLGIPGASHTLHIATRYGLPDALMAKAQAYRQEHSVWSEELIAKMERQMLEMQADQTAIGQLRHQLTAQEMQLSATLKRLQDEKHNTLKTWRNQLKTRLERTSDSLTLLERHLRQKLLETHQPLPELPKALHATSDHTAPASAAPLAMPETPEQRAYNHILAFQAKFKQLEQQGLKTVAALEAILEEESLTLGGETPLFSFKKGEKVFCVTLNEMGTLEKLHPNTQEATLRMGLLTAKVTLQSLRPEHWRDPGQAKRAIHQALAVKAGLLKQRRDTVEASRHAQTYAQQNIRTQDATHHAPHRLETAKQGNPAVCDLRGFRASEALELLDIHLDRCLPSGISPIRCIHGQGTGALKRAVREHLAKHPLVAHWHPEEGIAGGDGVTVLYFEAPEHEES
ncbi:MAG: Smr/MutS family protein [Vampirovibrionales bacterium]